VVERGVDMVFSAFVVVNLQGSEEEVTRREDERAEVDFCDRTLRSRPGPTDHVADRAAPVENIA
jgi:hypothetical protein